MKYDKADSLERIFKTAKRNAPFRGISFDLTLEDVNNRWETQQGRCYYSGKPLDTRTGSPFKVSLDRKDSNQGYTRDNTVLCSVRVNLMKRDMTLDEFTQTIRMLHEHMRVRGTKEDGRGGRHAAQPRP